MTLLTDATITDYAHLKNDVTMDLNDKKLQTDGNSGITMGRQPSISSRI